MLGNTRKCQEIGTVLRDLRTRSGDLYTFLDYKSHPRARMLGKMCQFSLVAGTVHPVNGYDVMNSKEFTILFYLRL